MATIGAALLTNQGAQMAIEASVKAGAISVRKQADICICFGVRWCSCGLEVPVLLRPPWEAASSAPASEPRPAQSRELQTCSNK